MYEEPADGKIRVIAFGAHPDDCELFGGGVAAKWAALGHKVKFVSVTNGDIGHHRMAGGPLAQRRKAEVEAAARIYGVAEGAYRAKEAASMLRGYDGLFQGFSAGGLEAAMAAKADKAKRWVSRNIRLFEAHR